MTAEQRSKCGLNDCHDPAGGGWTELHANLRLRPAMIVALCRPHEKQIHDRQDEIREEQRRRANARRLAP